jgi:hypothetical protein
VKNIISIFFFFFFQTAYCQHIPESDKVKPHEHLTLTDDINKSDVVIEGEVINQPRTDGFLLDPKSTTVFTSIIIRVSKIFKGDIKDTIIELVNEGGTIPGGPFKGVQSGADGSFIGKGYEGIFFLRPNNTSIQSGKNIQSFLLLYFNSYIVYANPMRSKYHTTYFDGEKITDFEKGLYEPIEAITDTPRKVVGLMPFEIAEKQQK